LLAFKEKNMKKFTYKCSSCKRIFTSGNAIPEYADPYCSECSDSHEEASNNLLILAKKEKNG